MFLVEVNMELKTCTKIKIVAGALALNTLFGLYNIRVTERVKPLTESQKAALLALNSLNTVHGFIHLLVNMKIGAYKE